MFELTSLSSESISSITGFNVWMKDEEMARLTNSDVLNRLGARGDSATDGTGSEGA